MSTDVENIDGQGRDVGATAAVRKDGRVVLVGALLVGTLASCGSDRPSQEPRSASPSRSVAGVPPSTFEPPLSALPVSPGAASSQQASVETADPSGDVTPASIDIVMIRLEPTTDSISLTMSLAATVPTGDPRAGGLAYRFYLDTDGDSTWDYMAALESAPNGDFVPVLVDRLPGRKREGATYPGTVNVSGQVVAMTVPLADIGCPARIAVRATAERTAAGSTSRDEAPEAATDWIRIDTGCPPR
jgi:hypothetical protein